MGEGCTGAGRGVAGRGLRGGGAVRRHQVRDLVACSVVVGPVLRAVVVGTGVRRGRRVSGVSVLLLLWVYWKNKFDINTFVDTSNVASLF